MHTKKKNVLSLGNCSINNPINFLVKQGLVFDAWSPLRDKKGFKINTPYISTPNELIQLINHISGYKSIPIEYHKYIWLYDYDVDNFDVVSDSDVALFEYRINDEIFLGDISLSRSRLMNLFVEYFAKFGELQKKIVLEWLNQGLLRANIERQISTANSLIESLPSNFRIPDLEKEILFNARVDSLSKTEDMVKELEKINKFLNKPIGVVSFIWKYLPDGRALTWPTDIRQKLAAACAVLDFPFFDPPVDLIEKFGIKLIDADRNYEYYNDNEMPLISSEFLKFVNMI